MESMQNVENRHSALFEKYSFSGKSTDCGSPESQIVVIMDRVLKLTEYIKKNPKDNVTKLSITKLVCKRRKMIKYLKSISLARYEALIKKIDK
ncbi:MAG: 30S ribosomal protein S15 [Cytophagales bacterium]|jgi:small subunit ribosomal protein S15|nr:30S ribosomal protein S15 [Cytophagales bacterium]